MQYLIDFSIKTITSLIIIMSEEQYLNLHAVRNLPVQNYWNHRVIFPLRLLCVKVKEMVTTAIQNIKTLIWNIAMVNFDLIYTSRLKYYIFNRNEFSTVKELLFADFFSTIEFQFFPRNFKLLFSPQSCYD